MPKRKHPHRRKERVEPRQTPSGPVLDRPGEPGAVTRPARSVPDRPDTSPDWGRMDRVFLRNLFTGRLRTRRPAYLAAMIFLGLTGTAQLVYSLTVLNPSEGLGMIAFVGILGIVSVALLVNAVLSLLT